VKSVWFGVHTAGSVIEIMLNLSKHCRRRRHLWRGVLNLQKLINSKDSFDWGLCFSGNVTACRMVYTSVLKVLRCFETSGINYSVTVRRQYIYPKHWEPITQWRGVIFHKNWVLSRDAVTNRRFAYERSNALRIIMMYMLETENHYHPPCWEDSSAPHNDVSVNDRSHIRQWSHNIVI